LINCFSHEELFPEQNSNARNSSRLDFARLIATFVS
jgi:hypothetical protein